jgi:hypothetical protein
MAANRVVEHSTQQPLSLLGNDRLRGEVWSPPALQQNFALVPKKCMAWRKLMYPRDEHLVCSSVTPKKEIA